MRSLRVLLAIVTVATVAVPALAASSAPKVKTPARKPAPVRPTAAPPPVLKSLTVEPAEVTLVGAHSERQLIVTGSFSDGTDRDLTDLVHYTATGTAVRTTADGKLFAGADGEAKVKAAIGKYSAWVKVSVKETGQDRPRSFRNEVIPILTRAGCNQGACHGAQLGKGGLKLSLLGFDPDADYPAIVRQNEARRVVLTDPEKSLLLMKPTMGVPHAGGLRFKPDSNEYAVLIDWLRYGAPGPIAEEPAPVRVEVTPAQRQFRVTGAKVEQPVTVAIPQLKGAPLAVKAAPGQRLAAIAIYKDGSTEDVTRKAQYNSLNDTIAAVDSDAKVSLVDRGATAIMVRYRGMATVARMLTPYREIRAYPQVAVANYVDENVARKWREMGLTPSEKCDDPTFIRRVYLDTIGILPPVEDVRAFLSSNDPDKRKKLIDAVLDRPEYVDYWTLKWGDTLRNNTDKLGPKGMWSFYNWLRTSFRDNKPMDVFVRDLITAQGSTYSVGPANYFRVANNPADLAETTGQVFLGVRLACAKCHHHPYEKWGQDDYWQMAAFFGRIALKGSQEFGLFGQEQIVRVNANGEVGNPRTGKIMKPTPLDGEPMEDPIDRRRALANWLTKPDNMMFSRNIVNRYWGYLFGRGITEPVDDVRVTNPPSNPELLDALAKDFVAHRFDVKHLLRTILNSETYQLSSTPTKANKGDDVFYSKYPVRRLGAEELLDAVNYATGSPDKFPNLPAGFRATQLPDPSTQNYFLDTFGRPSRVIVCECERQTEPTMASALHLINSDYVQNKLMNGSGRLQTLINAKKSDEEIVEEVFLVTFSRLPNAEELAKAQLAIVNAPNRKEGTEDVLWALLNSREFLFRH
jgi:hypothetical protein